MLFDFHLPWMLSFPLCRLFSLHNLWTKSIPQWKQLFLPFVITSVFLLFALVYDRICEHSKPLPLEGDVDNLNIRNVALYFHLPLAASGTFFLFHPGIGYLVFFFALCLSMAYSIEFSAVVHGFTRARSIGYWLGSFIFFLIPVSILLLIGNILRSVRIFQSL